MKLNQKDKLNSVKTFRRVLRINAVNDPDSVLTELMSHFEYKIVMRLIRLYSGKQIKIPDMNVIWRVYRDKIVRNELDKEDTRDRRMKLADYFSITLSHISMILRKERKDYPKASDMKIGDEVRHIYGKDLDASYKEVIEVYPGKGTK